LLADRWRKHESSSSAPCRSLAHRLRRPHSPDVVHPYEAQRIATSADATVLLGAPGDDRRLPERRRRGRRRGAGGVAAANAASYKNSGWAGLLGCVVGGVVGNAVERGATTQNGVELLLQMRNGERRSIVQANGNEGWMVGEPVVLVTTGAAPACTRAPQAGAQPVPQALPGPRRAYRPPRRLPAPVPV
jgi:outer membrane lipoprotein SlyB